MALIAPSRRLRRTPFSAGVEAAGVKAYSVYNRMLLPAMFESLEADYRHLKSHVQVWDVSCERQVALQGPDAAKLLQILTPRDVSKIGDDRCLYVPICDQNGGMLNDPVALKVGPDTYWVSIADSDLLLWVNGVASALHLDVRVWEPDVSPLAVQGPKADDLMVRIFGEPIRALKFFRHQRFKFQGYDLVIARSGYSKQGGFEIYVDDTALGMPLWDTLFAAGDDLLVRAGCPNLIERVEGGLLSYGNDMTSDNTPLECGLGKFISKDRLGECYGGRRLAEELETGSARQIRAIAVGGGPVPPCSEAWPLYAGGDWAGQITSAAWSPDFKTNVAIAMVEAAHWAAGTALEVETQDGMRRATVMEKFWN